MQIPETVLIPSARMPRSLPIVRAFGEAGARVHTCDTADNLQSAPTSHSRYIADHFTVAPPSSDPAGYVRDVAAGAAERGVSLIVPHFEETFYLAAGEALLPAPLLASPFPVLAELHDKSRFMDLCGRIGVDTPATTVVRDQDELREAVGRVPEYIAKPAFSRGGIVFLANAGPRAGERAIEDCHPSAENPWLVQEFVAGRDLCSFSIARDGEIVLHCPYEPSIEGPGGFGIQFATIDDFGSLEAARKVAAASGITGGFGIDFRVADDRMVAIECNARYTNGVYLVPHERVLAALLEESPAPFTAEPGHRAQWDVAIAMGQISRLSLPARLHELVTVADPYVDRHDLLPALEYLVTLRHMVAQRDASEEELAQAMLGDLEWNGEDLVGEIGAPAG